jgi:xanthine/uracil permease
MISLSPSVQVYMQVVGTGMLANVVPLVLGVLPCKALRAVLPRQVLANLVLLVSVSMLAVSFQLWAGGVFCDPSLRGRGSLITAEPGPPFQRYAAATSAAISVEQLCSGNARWVAHQGPYQGLPFGAPQYVGLGFLAFMMVLFVQIFGCPIVRDGGVGIAVLVAWMVTFLSPHWPHSPEPSEPTGSGSDAALLSHANHTVSYATFYPGTLSLGSMEDAIYEMK